MNRMAGRLWLVVACVTAAPIFATGCLSPNSLTCKDGRICPVGSHCDDLNHCTTAEDTCARLPEGAECMLSQLPGTCHSGFCRVDCGNGVRNGGEACDGADLGGLTCADIHLYYNGTTGLACTKDCTLDTSGCGDFCGDGRKNGPEACDGNDLGGADCTTFGAYEPAGLGCSSSCTFDISGCGARCGDAIVNGPELCDGTPPVGKTCLDYGFDRGLLGCSAACKAALEGCGQLTWTAVVTPSTLIALWEAGPDDVFAVSDAGGFFRWRGGTWRRQAADTNKSFHGIWGSGPDDVYAVGGDGATGFVHHWNGGEWSALTIGAPGPLGLPGPIGSAAAVGGSGAADVYVVGDGTVLHSDGQQWSYVTIETGPGVSGAAHRFAGVWASAPADVFITASDGGIFQKIGASWWESTSSQGFRFPATAIWGSSANDVYALVKSVGPIPEGLVLHWDGRRWNQIDVSFAGPNARFPHSLRHVAGSSSGDAFVAGDDVLLHLRDGRWEPLAFPGGKGITAIGVTPARVDVTGTFGESQLFRDVTW